MSFDSEASQKLEAALKDVKPFKITFNQDSFGYFSHNKSNTLWLKPVDGCQATGSATQGDNPAAFIQSTAPHHPDVLNLQARLQSVFPECDDLSKISQAGFQPHLSIGQFQHNAVDKFAAQFQKQWESFEFEVKEVYLISRADFNDPFHVRYAVRLGGES